MSVLLLFLSFAVILAGALLFTNAVEWIGHRMELGEGAVGSLLAAVGTAMPETLIAIVALVGATEGGDQVAIGAIVGAPFLLATLAMGLVGLFAYLYRERREQGLELDAHGPTLERDLIFFLIFFAVSLALAWGAPDALRIPVGIAVILAYVVYIRRTLLGGGEVQDHGTLNPLIFERRDEFSTNPSLLLCTIQLLVGLGAMVGGAHLFVEELLHIAESLGRRGGRPRPHPRPAGDRAAGEGQQLLLGPRRKGLACARQHHRRDGLPVDDPGRDRPRLHRLGAERQRGALRRPRPDRRLPRLRDAAPPGRFGCPRDRLVRLYTAYIVVVVVSA